MTDFAITILLVIVAYILSERISELEEKVKQLDQHDHYHSTTDLKPAHWIYYSYD